MTLVTVVTFVSIDVDIGFSQSGRNAYLCLNGQVYVLSERLSKYRRHSQSLKSRAMTIKKYPRRIQTPTRNSANYNSASTCCKQLVIGVVNISKDPILSEVVLAGP